MKTELIVTCGLPGSGKSTYVNAHWEDTHVIVCADEYRKVYTGRDFHRPDEQLIYTMVKVTVEVMLRRLASVVVDMTSLTMKDRRNWIRLAHKCGAKTRCLWMDASLEYCLKMNLRRDKRVPEDVIREMDKRFTIPYSEEGFGSVMKVSRGCSSVGRVGDS